MNHFWAIADEEINAGDAVIFDPNTGRVRKANQDDVDERDKSKEWIPNGNDKIYRE